MDNDPEGEIFEVMVLTLICLALLSIGAAILLAWWPIV